MEPPTGTNKRKHDAICDTPTPSATGDANGIVGAQPGGDAGTAAKRPAAQTSGGRLLVLVGPSGSGKTTLAKALGFVPLCTTTARAPRPGEVDGVDYHFVTADAFDRLVADGLMAEHAIYAGMRYGVPLSLVNAVRLGSRLSKCPPVHGDRDPDHDHGDRDHVDGDQCDGVIDGRVVGTGRCDPAPTFVIVLNADGVDTMRRLLGRQRVLAVHVSAPVDRLDARLRARGATAADIDKRIRQAEATEMTAAYVARCDAAVVNAEGRLDEALAAIRDLCDAYFASPTADLLG
ncbi:Guanylate kinase [Pandoravirus dulcis]|uniref:Guanylate kinase n=1 Tax=Pandoravirus dulcis TaxID=1349409 RepID=S4VT50_9VIRU|nr:guanylate kinase [Pandoravirus dulcis]AGO82580.1 Guanylate kinase [Pandoravirus dulcis]